MHTISRIFATLLLCFVLFPSFLAAQDKGTVLIASENTRFKKALVAELDGLFTAAGYSTTIVENSKKDLEKYNAADFSAVFITNSGVNSHVRPWVLEWLDRNRASGTYILLHTTQIRKWDVEAPVDAVTSASSKGDVKSLAQEYFRQILQEINSTDTTE